MICLLDIPGCDLFPHERAADVPAVFFYFLHNDHFVSVFSGILPQHMVIAPAVMSEMKVFPHNHALYMKLPHNLSDEILRLHAHDLLRKRALHHIINPQVLKHVPFFLIRGQHLRLHILHISARWNVEGKNRSRETFVLFLCKILQQLLMPPVNPVKLAERKHRILFYIKIRCVPDIFHDLLKHL